MKTNLLALAAVSIVVSISGCAPHNPALDLPPGTYQSHAKTTDVNGVTRDVKDTTTVMDDNGHKTAVINSQTTEKPPGFWNGLFHKSTSSQSQVIEDNN